MLIALLAFLIAPGSPSAQPPAPRPKLVCRGGGEREVGSHIRTSRRCMTAGEWEEEDARRDRVPVTLDVKADPADTRAVMQPK